VFSGVGKTPPELEEAIRAGVGFINVESTSELDTLFAVAKSLKQPANVGIRVNPDVATETPHPYTRTGEKTTKFGVPVRRSSSSSRSHRGRAAAQVARPCRCHIGSQITTSDPTTAAP